MKKLIYISCFISIIILSGCFTTINKDNNGPESTFNTLDNYGTWINIPGLGQVWQPSDETNWQPYYDGHWLWTNNGWMWVGNEPYGWVVYHYGYWTYDNYYGWIWVPSYDWQPARVRWYYSNGYVGWAPLPPPGFRSKEIYNKNYIRKTWVVVPEKNFINRDVGRYRTRDVEPGGEYIRNNSGERSPDVRNIERAYGRRIEQVKPEKEPVKEGNRRKYRVRIPEQARQNEINRNNQPVNPVPVPSPPTIRTPRPEPAKPSKQPEPAKPSKQPEPPPRIPPPPKPEVNKNTPGRPARPNQPEKVRKPENGRNENSIRNEGRKEKNSNRPEAIKQNENGNVNKRDEKTAQKDRNKIIKKDEKKVEKKNNGKQSGKEIRAKDSGVKKEVPKKERKNNTIR